MTLRIVGAGLGRTGTSSLRVALEQLLGAPSYHMSQVMARPDHIAQWRRLADDGVAPDWHRLFDGFAATLDWPAAAYWESIADAFPDALVLLSVRDDAEAWYDSFSRTIVPLLTDTATYVHPGLDMARRVTFSTFTDRVDDPEIAMRAYAEHNDRVRSLVPRDRLIEWRPDDGWAPLCQALGLPEPTDAFPHVNTGDEFRKMFAIGEARPAEPTPSGWRARARAAATAVPQRLRKRLR